MKYIKPKKGLLVRMPNGQKLPEVGGMLPWDGPEGRYWRRRHKDNSVDIFDEKPAEKVVKKKAKEEKS